MNLDINLYCTMCERRADAMASSFRRL
jgi:hypothetical protein